IAQGLGGLMSITGEPGRGPMRVGVPIADLTAGLFCALGILVALLEREQSGKGQDVATSLLEAQIFMLDFQASRWLNAREGAARGARASGADRSDRQGVPRPPGQAPGHRAGDRDGRRHAARRRTAGDLEPDAEPGGGSAAGSRGAHRRGAARVRFLGRGDREAAPGQGDLRESRMEKSDKMLARKEGRVGTMIFNNPERHNAVSLEMWQAAAKILEGFADDDEIRVVVLAGAGGKSFVSGADISKFEDERTTREAVERYNATTEKVYSAVATYPKPTIAMVQGYCMGGGLNLAVCCDLRFCSEGSRFGLPAAKLGLGYG